MARLLRGWDTVWLVDNMEWLLCGYVTRRLGCCVAWLLRGWDTVWLVDNMEWLLCG